MKQNKTKQNKTKQNKTRTSLINLRDWNYIQMRLKIQVLLKRNMASAVLNFPLLQNIQDGSDTINS